MEKEKRKRMQCSTSCSFPSSLLLQYSPTDCRHIGLRWNSGSRFVTINYEKLRDSHGESCSSYIPLSSFPFVSFASCHRGTFLKLWMGSQCMRKSGEFGRGNIIFRLGSCTCFHSICRCHLLSKGLSPVSFLFIQYRRSAESEFCSISMVNKFAVFDSSGMNES